MSHNPPPNYGHPPVPYPPPPGAHGPPPAYHQPSVPSQAVPAQQPQAYFTNIIYQQPTAPPATQPVQVADLVSWVPATASDVASLEHRAYVAGQDAMNGGSPLCVIRAHHAGGLIPGKLSIQQRAGYISYGKKAIYVYNFEVLCAPSHAVYWVPSSYGQVPLGAIPAGNNVLGDEQPLYIGRVKHKGSVVPGKIHPRHSCCYIAFGDSEIRYKTYEVLCKIGS